MKCPMCGYNDSPASQLATNIMNHYVHPDGKRVVGMNCGDETFTTKPKEGSEEKPITYTRKDVWDKQQVAKPSTPANTTSNTNPLAALNPVKLPVPAVPTVQSNLGVGGPQNT